jgi:dolichol-phosphate mannosyltransferase
MNMQHVFVRDLARLASNPLNLTIVVPVLNERENVAPLIERLELALLGIEWEVVFVDDRSSDGTPEVVEELARADRRVRLIRRYGRRGLSSAVVEGFLSSVAPVVAVIDGDLQHDETILPRLYALVAEGGCDMAVGTRYSHGGSTGDWDGGRKKISEIATRLALPVMKTVVSDPMSGFFAVRRSAVLEAAPYLSSVGYKILLDLLASVPSPLRVAEIPYTFASRTAGESKLDSAVALEYVELLLDKLVGRWIPAKLILFGAIGGFGLLVHLALLGLFLHAAAAPFATAQSLAVLCAMTLNFTLNNRLTYRDRRLTGARWWRGLVSFYLVCGIGAVANVGVGTLLYEGVHQWWIAGLLGALIGSVWNYAATAWLTWTRR